MSVILMRLCSCILKRFGIECDMINPQPGGCSPSSPSLTDPNLNEFSASWEVGKSMLSYSALQVSVGWLLYNMLAPTMLLWYCIFRNRGLTTLCTVISMITTITLVAIIVIIWLVLPKEFDWNRQLRDSLTFYDAQKSGRLPASNPIPWRGDSCLNDTAPNGASLVGGYYGDGGKVKPTIRFCSKLSTCIPT